MNLLDTRKTQSWQHALRTMITDPEELFQLLDLDMKKLPEAYAAVKLFPLKMPRELLSRIQKSHFHDPILRQFLPLGIETDHVEGFISDPLQEKTFNPVPGLLHKYKNRVLLTLTGACGVNCRYCFRRHFPYSENNPGTAGWQQALGYISDHAEINEVILSGGDPLVISDTLLADLSQKLAQIPHLKRLRIHSRLPIMIPQRITAELIDWCKKFPLRLILVTHCNHPQELTEETAEAMLELKKAGVTLLNQAVLLKDINDNVETLVQLSEALFSAHILPYYLHLLDKVAGAAHFEVPSDRGQHLMTEITQQLPGFLVPKLVYEQPGALSKTLVNIAIPK